MFIEVAGRGLKKRKGNLSFSHVVSVYIFRGGKWEYTGLFKKNVYLFLGRGLLSSLLLSELESLWLEVVELSSLGLALRAFFAFLPLDNFFLSPK